jgi:glutamine amidotransferase
VGGQVILVDAGTGNLRSVLHALQAVGAQVRLTTDPDGLTSPARIVLPGVGAFGRFMSGLASSGLAEAVQMAVKRGDPLLGICVGMQALFDVGMELGEFPGLGLIPGQVERFSDDLGVKIPQTGWNQVWPVRPTPLLSGLAGGEYVYFNHSFFCQPALESDTAAETDLGASGAGPRFTSIVQRDNLYGVQFHPEKSQKVGLDILENFLRI